MSKKTILALSLTSMVLEIIGTVIFLVQFFAFFSQAAQNCAGPAYVGSQVNVRICQSLDPTAIFTTFGWLELVLFLFALPGLIAWVGALVRAAKMQTWGWFVAVFMLGTLGALIYALVWPAQQPLMVVGYAMPYPQPYPPQYPSQPYQPPYPQQ